MGLHSYVDIAEPPSQGMERPRDLRGCAGTSWKVACAVGRDLSIGQLAELLVRDRLLAAEVRAAMERAPGLPWDSRVPRIGSVPRTAQGAQQPAPRPSAPAAPERAPQRDPDAALARYPVQPAPVVPAPAPTPAPLPAPAAPAPRRGALPRRAAPAGDGMGELQALVAQRLGATS